MKGALIVDAFDETMVFGRWGVERYAAYIEDLPAGFLARIHEKVSNHGSVLVPEVELQEDWKLLTEQEALT